MVLLYFGTSILLARLAAEVAMIARDKNLLFSSKYDRCILHRPTLLQPSFAFPPVIFALMAGRLWFPPTLPRLHCLPLTLPHLYWFPLNPATSALFSLDPATSVLVSAKLGVGEAHGFRLDSA